MPTDQAYGAAASELADDGRPPASNTGVVNGSYGWDWTQTTHDARGSSATVREVVTDLLGALDGTEHLPGKGMQGWAESVQVFDRDGYDLGRVYFGGNRTDVHVVSTSGSADVARPRVVERYGARTSRVDTRVDTLLDFDTLEQLLRSAAGRKARLTTMASEQDGRSLGRTLYVGAPTSAVRVRVYEKWLESPGQYVEGTNRVEVQLRPPSRAKAEVSTWTPAETFCASELTRRVADLLGNDVAHPATLQKNRGVPDLERTLEAMGRQYGPGVGRWLKTSGGDLGRVLEHLGV